MQVGAWFRNSTVYSPADVASLVTYAADRGIRVVPEIDVPSHARAMTLSPQWGRALVQCDGIAGMSLHDQDKYALDPTAPEAYALLALITAGALHKHVAPNALITNSPPPLDSRDQSCAFSSPTRRCTWERMRSLRTAGPSHRAWHLGCSATCPAYMPPWPTPRRVHMTKRTLRF